MNERPQIEPVPDRKAIPPFASLRAFEAVGRLGGIRKAATELCVDHAVVSRHLRALEAWLGLALFDRSATAPRLNATGREYHKVVSSAIMAIARGTREIVGDEGGTRLLVWCVPGFASRWLVANLEHFHDRHPEIEVELRPTDSGPDFNANEADADIRFVRDLTRMTPAPAVSVLNFARPGVFPVASPDWVRENGGAAAPEDLLGLKLLHEENDEDWRGWFVANGAPVGARIPGSRLWHAHLALDAARRGQGVALANPFLVADDLAEGVLQPVLPPGAVRTETGTYVFCTREDSLTRPAIRKFRDWIALRAADFLAEDTENRVAGSSEPQAGARRRITT